MRVYPEHRTSPLTNDSAISAVLRGGRFELATAGTEHLQTIPHQPGLRTRAHLGPKGRGHAAGSMGQRGTAITRCARLIDLNRLPALRTWSCPLPGHSQ